MDINDIIKKSIENIKKEIPEEYHNLIDKDIYRLCCKVDLKPTKENFKTYYNVDYYKKLKEPKFPIKIKKHDWEQEESILQFIKTTDKLLTFMIWPVAIKNYPLLKKVLKKEGKILVEKEFSLTKKQAEGFLFQTYFNKKYHKFYKNILEEKKKKGFTKDNNKLIFVLYKPKGKTSLYQGDGTENTKKQEFRKILSKNIKLEGEFEDRILIHIPDNYTELLELCYLVLNKNSLEFLKYQRVDLLLGKYKNFIQSYLIHNFYKKWLYTNFSLIDINRFVVFSSYVLFNLGLRRNNDVDCFFYHKPKYNKKLIEDFLTVNLGGKERRVIELFCKGYGDWTLDKFKDYPHKWFEKEWPNKYGAKDYEDVIFNPRNHYYFMGIKVIHWNGDFARRLSRNRPAALADIIAINRLTHLKVDIPPLPKTYWKNHVEIKFSEKEISELRRKIIKYLKYRFKIFISDIQLDQYIKI